MTVKLRRAADASADVHPLLARVIEALEPRPAGLALERRNGSH